MATYTYRCESCGELFVRQQSMSDRPLTECPECQGPVHRVITGGAGFVLKGGSSGSSSSANACSTGACSLEATGRTCCGLTERCR